MSEDQRRVRAVLSVMKSLRDQLRQAEHIESWDTAVYDQWLTTLDGALDIEFADMRLDDSDMDRTLFLVHIEALIAFLEVYETEGASVTPLRPKVV